MRPQRRGVGGAANLLQLRNGSPSHVRRGGAHVREGGGRRGTERGPLRRGVVGEGKVPVPPDGLLRLADGGHEETRLGGIEERIGGRFGMVLRGIPRSGGATREMTFVEDDVLLAVA